MTWATCHTGTAHAFRGESVRSRCGLIRERVRAWRYDHIVSGSPVCRTCRRLVAADRGQGPEWDEDEERDRLASIDAGPDWPEAWAWIRRERPDVAELVDDVLDLIVTAFRARDTGASEYATMMLDQVVRLSAETFTAFGPPANTTTPRYQETSR